tara:strand:- start:876 stop:1358 length:483 start_codon:yes stop_codon:yes gene_type:complete
MSAALITATFLGISGLCYSTYLGFIVIETSDILAHTSFSIFSILITLLAHSMTMFYLIGKGKAIREAAEEGSLSTAFYRDVVVARRPVFSKATIAMSLTIVTAVFGGGVDIGSIPLFLHSTLAIVAIVSNLLALRVEILAMLTCSRIVAEVDALLEKRTD